VCVYKKYIYAILGGGKILKQSQASLLNFNRVMASGKNKFSGVIYGRDAKEL